MGIRKSSLYRSGMRRDRKRQGISLILHRSPREWYIQQIPFFDFLAWKEFYLSPSGYFNRPRMTKLKSPPSHIQRTFNNSRTRIRVPIRLLRNPYPVCQFLDTAVRLHLAEENMFRTLVIRRREGDRCADPLPVPQGFQGFDKSLGR